MKYNQMVYTTFHFLKFAFSLLNPEATKKRMITETPQDMLIIFLNIHSNHVNQAVSLSAHFTDKEWAEDTGSVLKVTYIQNRQ